MSRNQLTQGISSIVASPSQESEPDFHCASAQAEVESVAAFQLPALLKTDGGPVFDVDSRTGFMAPHPPLRRLPARWELWESLLDEAIASKLQVGEKHGLTDTEKKRAEEWRTRVRQIPLLSISELNSSVLLRRAHLVLAFLEHFYVQSLPPDVTPIIIPRSISLPILRVSKELGIPPLLTFSDTVLYNWYIDSNHVTSGMEGDLPTVDNVRIHTMFTNLVDEEEFYLCSARIELRGVKALELMRVTMDETFIGDSIAIQRVTDYMEQLASVIDELKDLLMDVKRSCRPDVYYNVVRPWFRGEDSALTERRWVFEGAEEESDLKQPKELSGPSAGQSSIIHVLDVFLGVDHQASAAPGQPSFMSRMKIYMPQNHRSFLDHLAANSRPLRSFVITNKDEKLTKAYNEAVLALKRFRDAHMIIAALYIIGPARRAARATAIEKPIDGSDSDGVLSTPVDVLLKGTGGTDLVKFLKDTRSRTIEAKVE